MKPIRINVIIVFLLLPYISIFISAEESKPNSEPVITLIPGEEQNWELRLIPYLWASSLKADSTVRGSKSSIDMSFSDIFERLDSAFIGYAEVRRKRCFFYINTLYMGLSDDVSVSQSFQRKLGPRLPANFPPIRGSIRGDFQIEMKSMALEFAGGYRLYEKIFEDSVADNIKRKLGLDAFAGIRYWLQETDLDGDIVLRVDPPGRLCFSEKKHVNISEDQQWVDPIIGARIQYDVLKNVSLGLTGDIGGFGLGSDFTWSAVATASWQFHKNWRLIGGYRYLDVDYESGSGDNKYAFDGSMQGPILGVMFQARW